MHRSWPYLGGAERLFWEWAKSSRDAGYEVTLFTTDVLDIEYFHDRSKRRIEATEEVVEGINIKRFRIRFLPKPLQAGLLRGLSAIPVPFLGYVFGYPYILLPGYLCKMLLMRERFDLVNAGVFPHLFLAYPALRYARKNDIPSVCTPLVHLGEPHGLNESNHFLSSKHVELLKNCKKVIAMTHIEKEALLKKGIREECIHVIGAGVDPEEVKGGNGTRFREKYGIRGKMVLQISTQTHDKGSPHLIEAMKRLWSEGKDVTLVLIGQVMSDFDAYFFKQASRVYEKTLVLDYIDEKTKKDALDACDMFIMPSKADSFGIVYLEAGLYKKPVIGVYAGGVPEVVQDGKEGLLVPFADVHMLSEYIRLLLMHPTLADAMGHNGYLKVMKQYTWRNSCDKLLSMYGELVA